MRQVLLCLLLLSCNKSNDAKDREIATLKAQLAAQGASSGTPSLGAVHGATPALIKPKVEPEAKPQETPSPLVFLLERIQKESANPGSLTELYDRANLPDNRAIRYAHLEKNAARYIGRPWNFTGRIVEIVEKPDSVMARVSLDWYDNHIMMVFGRFESDFVKGNTVDVIGYLAGSFSYESRAKWQITIPVIAAHSMLKAGTLRKLKAATRTPRPAEEDEE